MKKNKFSVKHPLFLFLSFPFVILLGGATIMLHIDRVYKLPNYVNIIVGISLCVFSIIWLILFSKNFGKFINKEENTKINKIKKYAFSNKSFVLIQKRNVVANFALLLGGISVFIAWLIFLPITQFSHYGYWIFRVISIVVTVLGFIFSFVTPQKMLVYKNGELIITTDEIKLTIKPSELIEYKRNPSYKKDKNLIRQQLYSDIILYLSNREILLKKADCDWFLKKILKSVKEIEKN